MLATSASTNAAAAGFQQIAAPQLKQAAQQAQQAANTLQAQARDAWKRVDSAKAVAHVIDARANQAVSSADKAKQNLNSFGAAVLSAKQSEGASASASTTPPPGTYAVSANVVATAPIAAPIVAPAQLNTTGQVIGARVSVEA